MMMMIIDNDVNDGDEKDDGKKVIIRKTPFSVVNI